MLEVNRQKILTALDEAIAAQEHLRDGMGSEYGPRTEGYMLGRRYEKALIAYDLASALIARHTPIEERCQPYYWTDIGPIE